jgi:hypothetical protein
MSLCQPPKQGLPTWARHVRLGLLAGSLLLLAGCLDHSEGGSPKLASAAPTISAFTGGASTITTGTATTLDPVFANGTGSIDHGIGTVTSGTPVSTGNLGADTTFTLTVTNAAGTSETSQVVVDVAPAPATPTISAPTSALMGSTGLTAAVTAQDGMTYAWTISNGSITAGDGTSQVTFTAGTPGLVQLGCTSTNAAGTAATSSFQVLAYATPGTPSIQVVSNVTDGVPGYQASTAAQTGVAYAWTITNGTITAGSTSNQITFTPALPSPSLASAPMQLTCTVTNGVQTSLSGNAGCTVVAMPTASLGASTTTPLGGQVVTLTPLFAHASNATLGTTQGGSDLGTGITSSLGYPLPSARGTHVYWLRATNAAGTSVDASVQVAYQTVGIGAITPAPTTVVAGSQTTFQATVTHGFSGSVTWSSGGIGSWNSGTWTAPTTVGGPYTLTATAQDDPTVSTTLNVSTVAGAPASLAIAGGNSQSAVIGTSFSTGLAVLVTDANGNPVPGVSVGFAGPVSGASGTFAGSATASATTGSNGIATAPACTANTVAGSYSVLASAGSLSTSFSLTNTPGAATSLTLTGFPSPVAVQLAATCTVTAYDAHNNTATGYAGTLHFTSSDATATLPANATLVNGVGTFSITLNTTGTQSITATDTVVSALTATQSGITVQATAPAFSTQPASQSATVGDSVTFTVAVTGSPTPTLIWQRSNDHGATWNPIPSQTGTSYSLTVASGDNLAQFRAVATNSVTTVNSNAATLSVVSVYAGGYCNPIQTYPGYWLNGTWDQLPGLTTFDSEVTAIVVSGTDVYSGGYSTSGSPDYQGAYIQVPGYWKNTTWHALTPPDTALTSRVAALLVSGTDIYTAGYAEQMLAGVTPAMAKSDPVYWKNGTLTVLANPENNTAQATCMVMDGSSLWVGGTYTTDQERLAPALWDSAGTRHILSVLDAGHHSGLFGIGVDSNGVIYASGYSTGSDGTVYPGYWSGTSVDSLAWHYLPYWSNQRGGAVRVSGTDVYIVCTGSYSGYWKNGLFSSVYGPSSETACSTGLSVSGADVYVSGFTLDPSGEVLPGYWKNGSWVALPVLTASQPQYAMSEANCIVVQ